MDIYYSQHGEDFLLDKVFEGKSNGYYVEIGCLDGIEFSNTYFFEKKGWKGACIEAHNDFITSLKINRPNASIIHCAVGDEDKDNVTFYANKIGSLSTLDKNEEARWIKNYKDHFHGFEEQNVRMSTLTTIFDELKIEVIDFVSLDIEGYEVQALRGLDFKKYKPTVFVIEYKDEDHLHQLNQILLPQGYSFLSRLGCNLFYSLNKDHERTLTAPYGSVQLLQIDMNGNKIWHQADLLTPTLNRKIKSFIGRSLVGKSWRYSNTLLQRFFYNLKIPSYKKKRAILDKYRRAFDLKIFVETGTFLGDTVDYFKNRFDNLYSIELSEELYAGAKKRFEQSKNVTILQGDSGKILSSLVSSINRPALYWLDGHYSSEFYMGDRFIITAKGDKVTPIVSELQILLYDTHQHVILIDDARLFNGEWDYPKLEEIEHMVKVSPKKYNVHVANDIIRIIPIKK